MENATKALLIAAAVLVVIVIIALGVRLLGTASDTSGKADEVSQGITNAIDNQTSGITQGLQKYTTTEDDG